MVHYSDVDQAGANDLLFLNCVNFFLFLGQAFVTVGIGQFGLFSFLTTQQISIRYPTLITTAPWVTFTVTFILIVTGLIWASAQLFPEYRIKSNDGVKHYYVGVALCQIVWVIMFSYEIVFISLFAAMALLFFLGIILYDQSKILTLDSMLDYWVVKFPFVFYFGWIVYVILWNLCVVLVDYEASTSTQYWVALFSLVAMGMTSFSTIFYTRAEYAIPSVIAFATVRRTREDNVTRIFSFNASPLNSLLTIFLSR